MTGSAADEKDWQPHIRSRARLDALAKRFRDPKDPLRLVIVRDMWLTGFDAPSLHTLYVDKPMQGHGLMQAIARVNRVFGDKPGGLVVDYLGMAECLRRALSTYTDNGGKGETAVDQNEAVAVMLEKLEICRDFFHGFDYRDFLKGNRYERVRVLGRAVNFVYGKDDGRDRIVPAVVALEQAFALAVPATRPRWRSATRSRSSRPSRRWSEVVRHHRRSRAGGRRDGAPPAGVQGAHRRGRHRCLRGRGPEEARHQRPLRGVPGRGGASCRTRTWRPSCCASSSTTTSRRAASRTSSRPRHSPKSSSGPSPATATARSRRCRSSRS
jgi:GNAT superfamily N-acetyltransferase